jgi:hypothetical protein
VTRKNPLAVVQAFTRAFPDEGEAALAVKTVGGTTEWRELERLRHAAGGREDVVFLDGRLDGRSYRGLFTTCDAYVSLHRSEGFGLTLAEAMSLGKPVVATAYSGNLEFMTDANSYLVDWREARVPVGCDPYPAGASWAEPDVDHAVSLMRRLYEHPVEARERGQRGRADIAEHHSIARVAGAVAERLAGIRSRIGRPLLEPALWRAGAGGPAARAEAFLQSGPEVGWAVPSSFGGAGLFARRALVRALRPYTTRREELDHHLVDAALEAERSAKQVTELAERVAELETRLLGNGGAQAESGPADVNGDSGAPRPSRQAHDAPR